MFSFVKGKVIKKATSFIEIEVNGLGFEIMMSLNSLKDVGEFGSEALIYTYIVFRDDSFQIYGFSTREEKEIFRELIKISGVGPKIALAILSYLKVEEFIDCVAKNEVKKLTGLPGIGKKTAERVLLEFREKVKKLKDKEQPELTSDSMQVYEETISALTVLGYQENKVRSLVLELIAKLPQNELTVENLLKHTLKELVK